MIIYGYSTKVGEGQRMMQGACPGCGKGPLNAYTVFRYFHIYWIPLFPFSRKVSFVCENCQKTFSKSELNEADRFGPLSQVAPDRIPLRLFAGSALIAGLIAFGMYTDHKKTQETAQYLHQPQESDLYVVKMDKPVKVDKAKLKYTVLRLVGASSDEVVFQPSTYAFSSGSAAKNAVDKELKKADAFESEQVMSIKRAELENFMKSGKIYTIVRGSAVPVQIPNGIKVSTR